MTATKLTTDELARVCTMIKEDMEEDVHKFDGRPLDGKVVAEIHGVLAATCSALAGLLSHVPDLVRAIVADAINEHREDAPHIYADGSTS